MNTFDTERERIAAKLTAAIGGAPLVTTDPSAAPPCIVVDLVRVNTAAGPGGWSSSLPIKIIVPPPGDAQAAGALGDMLEVVLRTLGFAPAYPTTVTVGTADCPAYVATYTLDIPNPDC